MTNEAGEFCRQDPGSERGKANGAREPGGSELPLGSLARVWLDCETGPLSSSALDARLRLLLRIAGDRIASDLCRRIELWARRWFVHIRILFWQEKNKKKTVSRFPYRPFLGGPRPGIRVALDILLCASN